MTVWQIAISVQFLGCMRRADETNSKTNPNKKRNTKKIKQKETKQKETKQKETKQKDNKNKTIFLCIIVDMANQNYNDFPNVGAGDIEPQANQLPQEHNPQQVLQYYDGAHDNMGANGVMGNEVLHHMPVDYYNAVYLLLGHSMLGRNADNVVTELDNAQWVDIDIMWTLIYWYYEERSRINGILTNHIRRIMHFINLYELRVINSIRNNQIHNNQDNQHNEHQYNNEAIQYPNNYNELPLQQPLPPPLPLLPQLPLLPLHPQPQQLARQNIENNNDDEPGQEIPLYTH